LRASKLDPSEDYILARLAQGCKSAAQIHREITEMGFSGGRSHVKAYVAHLRTSTAEGATPVKRSERAQALSPRSLRWLLTRERKDLEKARASSPRPALDGFARGADRSCAPAHVSLTGARAHTPALTPLDGGGK
jgi:transposase